MIRASSRCRHLSPRNIIAKPYCTISVRRPFLRPRKLRSLCETGVSGISAGPSVRKRTRKAYLVRTTGSRSERWLRVCVRIRVRRRWRRDSAQPANALRRCTPSLPREVDVGVMFFLFILVFVKGEIFLVGYIKFA